MRSFACLLLLLATAGCRGGRISPEQLTGTWTITSDSLRQLPPAARNSSTGVTLFANGTFSARDLPGFARPLEEAPDSGTGTWKIDSNGERVLLIFQAGTLTNYGGELFIDSPHELLYFLGDPDDSELVVFTRKP